MRFLIASIPLFGLVAFGQGGGGVQFRDWGARPVGPQPKIACAQLRSLTSYELTVISATTIAAAGNTPEHCRVSVLVAPELHIEVNLPAAWNSRLYMFGNGGFAGESFDAPNRVNTRATGLRNGFTTAATDTGHSAATEPGATFAVNQQKLVDFGFHSLHLTAVVAKQMISAYYGRPPSKSYYEGCSFGGRQGLILAQRFPEDFDAIIAGAPALDQIGTMLSRAWWMQGLADAPIPASKLKLLAERVYQQCDAKDGLKDGLIDDPRKCGFKPSADLPRCAGGAGTSENAQPDCFTTGQIAALERIYSDVISAGKRFFPGYPVSGEAGWSTQIVNGPNGSGVWTRYAETFLQYEAYPEKDPKLPLARFDINKDPARTTLAAQILSATDTDLTAFRQHGGKLIMYFGWADPQLNPMMGVEYYEKVEEKMGPSTQDFFRLFMVPGMYHCGGGVGPNVFDAATPLLKWSESGTAPDQITASRIEDGKVVRTRPLCAYPQVARYKGTGSIDDATNFQCARP